MANGKKNYYDILGVSKSASDEEIKKAYRKMAREHHPDVVSDVDKEAAEARFKEINEAYRILSDPEKRKMYDQYGTADFGNGFGGAGASGGRAGQWGPFSYTYTNTAGSNDFGFGDFDPLDIFEDFFGFRGYNSTRTPRKGKNLYYEMPLQFSDAVFGLEKEISVESGKFKVKIPIGIRDGMELKFSGKGMPGPSGAPSGDLFLTIRVHKPSTFSISGDNLIVIKEIDLITATLGGIVEVPVVDLKDKSALGITKLKIPAGTDYGSRFVLRGKGMPRLNGRGQGDVLVQVAVVVPKKLNKKQKDLLEEFQSV